MFGGYPCAPAEHQQVAGHHLAKRFLAAMATRRLKQRIAVAGLGPVWCVRARQFALCAINLAPHAAHEAEAIATHSGVTLMAVRHTDP